MISKWLERVLYRVIEQHYKMVRDQLNYPGGATGQKADPLDGAPHIGVHRISNGFLLSSSHAGRYERTLVYCKDVQEISEQIVVLHTREAMGIPGHVNITAHGGGGSGGSGIAKATLASYPITTRP
jgi:hypothetical protein